MSSRQRLVGGLFWCASNFSRRTATTPRSLHHLLRPFQHATTILPRAYVSTGTQSGTQGETRSSSQSSEGNEQAEIVKSEQNEHKEADSTQSPVSGPIGGFMRGLIGGHAVAAEDAFVAEAKRQGIDIPPPPPPRRADLVPMKRRKRKEEEAESEQSIRDRLFSRFSGSAFMQGVFDARERISERIDESNNPVINFFRNIYDNVFAENEMAMVIREIRQEDDNFTISEFLREVEAQHIPIILSAYLAADRDKLKKLCTEEAYQMLNASIREREHANVTIDTNILAINDVELTAGKLLEDAPVLIVSFSTQQINCLRDPAGNVVEGKEDDIRAVYYVWAFVREVEYEHAVPTGGGVGDDNKRSTSEAQNGDSDTDSDTESAKDRSDQHEQQEGETNSGPPPWKMMEMVIRGIHSTI